MFCKGVSEEVWRKNQELIEAEADFMMDLERVRNKEFRFLSRFFKRAVKFFFVKRF